MLEYVSECETEEVACDDRGVERGTSTDDEEETQS